MTSRRPFMPLYIADYLADTAHLRALESGAYLHLLMAYWVSGGLPHDDNHLAAIAKVSDEQWTALKPTIKAFFNGDGWRHKRVDSELAHAADVSRKRSAAAKLPRSKRKTRRSARSNSKAIAKQLMSNSRADATTLHTLRDNNNLPTSGPRAKAAASEASTPPPHHLAMDGAGHVYIQQGTEDWAAYAADYRAHRGAEPSANSHGGRWFNISGEATK